MGYISAYFAWMSNGDILRIKLSTDAQDSLDDMLSHSIDKYSTYQREEYSDYKIEDNEVYQISNFISLPANIDQTLVPLNSDTVEYSAFDIDDVKSLIFPFIFNNVQHYAFQAPRRETKTLRGGLKLFLDRDTFTIDTRSVITITGDIDCIVTDQTAVFRSGYFVQRFFPLLDYYRQATADDVARFVHEPSLNFENAEIFTSMADDKVMRRKIAFLLDQGFFTSSTPDDIQAKAQSIMPGVDFVANGCIHFPNDKTKCKQILKMFCDEVYHGTYSNEVFETNSKKRISAS